MRLRKQPERQEEPAQTRKRGAIPWPASKASSDQATAVTASSGAVDTAVVRTKRAGSASVLEAVQSPVTSDCLPALFPRIEWDILSIAPVELARQLCIQHFDFFSKIKPGEFLEQRWARETKLSDAPNICSCIELFNVFSGMVSTTILYDLSCSFPLSSYGLTLNLQTC